MQEALISFQRECEISIHYKGKEIGSRSVDFLVEGSISVELKALTKLDSLHYAQAINCLEAFNLVVYLRISNQVNQKNHLKIIVQTMSATPKEQGQDVAHELMASPTITITQPGYIYIYLSNEETSPVEVYFDDFRVTQTKSAVIQVDDYYPFGLSISAMSFQRENSLLNKYRYAAKEEQIELNLEWFDYSTRMYMPEIARWGVIDNKSEKYSLMSPYSYAANEPISVIDPDGQELVKVIVPADSEGATTKTVLVDSRAAAQFSKFVWALNSEFGLVITSSFRSKTQQADMRARWDSGDHEGLEAQPARKSAHNGGFAIDVNVRSLGLTRDNHSSEEGRKLLAKLSEFAKKYGFSYGGNFQIVDVVHFYLKEKDFGYKNRNEAIDANDKYMRENGDKIPEYGRTAPEDKKDKKQGNSGSGPTWRQSAKLICFWIRNNPNIKFTSN
jgi:GxxExxY protein